MCLVTLSLLVLLLRGDKLRRTVDAGVKTLRRPMYLNNGKARLDFMNYSTHLTIRRILSVC